MKFFSRLPILTILTISIISLFYFKPIWKDRLIPFPGNLLISYFSPWKEESWPGYPTGVPRKGLLGFDTVRMMGPWRNFITKELKSSRFPSWNPHQFGGTPMSANYQSALFFPPNLIYLILPFYVAWTILIISQPILAATGMYLLLKALFNVSLSTHQRINALTITFLSFMYGFSAWMSVWIEWNIHGFVYALLPFGLLFIHKRKTILTILTISFIIFAGHPQMALIGISALAIFVMIGKKFKWFITVMSVVLLITSVQWFPSLKYYQQASREKQSSEFVYENTLLPWKQLSQLIVPNFFGNPATGNFSGKLDFLESTAYSGIAILGLAMIGLLAKNKKSRGAGSRSAGQETRNFAIILLVLISVLVLPNPISLLIGKLNIPILSTSVASRWLMLLPLGLTLLAAVGITEFFSNKAWPREARPGLYTPSILLISIIGLWIYALFFPPEFRSVSFRNLIIPTVIAGLFFLTFLFKFADRQSGMKVFLLTLYILSIGELILFGWKTMPYTEKRFIYPVTPVLEKLQEFSRDGSRFAATDGSVIDSNFATYYGLYDLSGYDALYPRKIGELVWSAANNGKPVKDFSRSTVVVPTKQSDARNNLWNLSGVRWIINKDDMLAEHPGQRSSDLSSDFELIWEEGKWQIYKNTKVYSRAFFTTDISQIPPISLITPAEIVSSQSNLVEITVDAPSDGYLVLTDTFYPGWKATVDGNAVEIIPAFRAFRAVQVLRGSHAVRFNL
ncbi:hypothetical protein HZB78_05230 [Candidatus Collierbacteria bacterium]|nr:hypothetical protein [Candidatus Collierbacteria bacterium]